jgi:hypothetical protein
MMNCNLSDSQQAWPTDDSFSIGSININSLITKMSDFSVVLDNNGWNFNIFGISESRCHKYQPHSLLNLPHYHDPVISYTSGMGDLHRVGLALYIRDDIAFNRRIDLESRNIECIWIQFRLGNQKILLGQIYRHPSSTNVWFDDFSDMMDSVYYENCNVFLMGDFNLDLIGQQGYVRNWMSLYRSYQLFQLITLPTHVLPSRNGTLIDHIYTNSSHLVCNTYVPMCGISDHYPVVCCLNGGRIKSQSHSHRYVTYRSMKKFNTDSFLFDLANAPFDNVLSHNCPNDALSVFIEIFNNIVDRHAPLKSKRVRNSIKSPWLTDDIITKMRRRDKIDKRVKPEEYRQIRNEIKGDIRRAKEQYFKDLTRNKSDSAALWKAINLIKKGNKSRSPFKLDPDAMNMYFSNVVSDMLGTTYGNDVLDENMSVDNVKIREFVSSRLRPGVTFDIPFLTSSDVLVYLNSLKTKKAAGIDGISPYFIKMGAPCIYKSLTYIYNLCIYKGIVPTAFKCGKVTPIHKKGSFDDMNNYRPITVLSVLTKPLEKHIQSHLLRFFELHSLFNTYQSAFRKFHSCQSAALRITEKYLRAFDDSKLCGTVFVDFSKAFDTINHDLLLSKLNLYGFSNSSLNFFTSYLKDREQCVAIQSKVSSTLPVHCGVPQGSILGPILFCIFINDLPLYIEHCDSDLFADDTTMGTIGSDLDTIENDLTVDMGNVVRWSRLNRMLINFTKTTYMLLCSRQKRQRLSRTSLTIIVNINDSHIILPQTTCQKLLGIYIDQNLTFHNHVDYVSKKISSSVYQMNCLKHFLDQRTMKLFYFGHVQPHIDYCSSIWGHCSDTYKKHLSSLQRRAIKLILDIRVSRGTNIDHLFTRLNILPLEKRFYFNDAVLMFKIIHNTTPSYLNDLVSQKTYFTNDTRFHLPTVKLNVFKMSFSFHGPKTWNELPYHLRNTCSFTGFKRILFDFILHH